jgi:hypothetical protein
VAKKEYFKIFLKKLQKKSPTQNREYATNFFKKIIIIMIITICICAKLQKRLPVWRFQEMHQERQ